MIIAWSHAVVAFCGILAAIWGFFWNWYIRERDFGRFLMLRRTWVTVVIGIGADMLLLLPVLYARLSSDPIVIWLQVVGIIGLSAIGICRGALKQEADDTRKEMDRARRTSVE